MTSKFNALIVRKAANNTFVRNIEEKSIDDLPAGDVLIKVYYSSINYKDCLSCMGNPAVTRHFPHTPGIDAVGVVFSSLSKYFKEGDKVIVIGHALGMSVPGGFGQFIRVPAKWIMHLPNNITLRESAIFGTAGFTAALSVDALQINKIYPNSGSILVTGATGGVGATSVAILNSLGYDVTASTGKANATNFLLMIGAKTIITRSDVNDLTGRNLMLPTWMGAIDTVGGNTLATLLKMCKENGSVIATGMVESTKFSANVLPFILRGIKLVGINAENTSLEYREMIWELMSNSWKPQILKSIGQEINLVNLSNAVNRVISGDQIGRTIINMQ